jgi:hypothetical protein
VGIEEFIDESGVVQKKSRAKRPIWPENRLTKNGHILKLEAIQLEKSIRFSERPLKSLIGLLHIELEISSFLLIESI